MSVKVRGHALHPVWKASSELDAGCILDPISEVCDEVFDSRVQSGHWDPERQEQCFCSPGVGVTKDPVRSHMLLLDCFGTL